MDQFNCGGPNLSDIEAGKRELKELEEAFEKIKNKDDPNGKIDTVIEIPKEEMEIIREAAKHFTGKDVMFLPYGVGREPFTYVLRVISHES